MRDYITQLLLQRFGTNLATHATKKHAHNVMVAPHSIVHVNIINKVGNQACTHPQDGTCDRIFQHNLMLEEKRPPQ